MGKRKGRRATTKRGTKRATKRATAKRATRARAGAKRATRAPAKKARGAAGATGKKRARGAAARKPARGAKAAGPRRREIEGGDDRGQTVTLLRDLTEHHETGPAASAGDIDADWQRAQSSGEEAVGGSVSTPDQDRVDDIGHALGVEQPSEAPLRPTEEILEERDRRYWELERRADKRADRRREP
jgi:hypothetical protein